MKEGRPGGDREGAEMEIDKKRAAGGIQKDDELRSKQMDKRATVTERGGEEINERECTKWYSINNSVSNKVTQHSVQLG